MSLDYLCRWQVRVSVYCAMRIPACLRGTKCSMLLYFIYICLIPYNYLSVAHNANPGLFVVVGPGFVSTSLAFIKSSVCCCCLPTPMTLASGGSPMTPLVVHQLASPSIWPAVQLLRRGLSTNPGVTMWCVCGCS